ncbi:flagellin [Methanoregula sp. UBA64]|uniref:flagellin n=1 Tax=Methanoregula sp. UBA64 TaxID=1915554 RepID=UPI0025EF4676|nr:flagellin [Methanoregula sp. UBA64]
MSSLKYNDEGFTGLEAAIVLIAFVVVAAVFSYVVLGAGFFTTQKAQETVHTSVQQASSTLEIVGNVYGSTAAGSTNAGITSVNFTVALAPGGTAVDFSKVVLTYSNATVLQTLNQTMPTSGNYPVTAALSAGHWGVTGVNNDVGTSNDLLESGEQFQVTAMPPYNIMANDRFTIEIKPAVGAAFDITRSVPGGLNQVNLLY